MTDQRFANEWRKIENGGEETYSFRLFQQGYDTFKFLFSGARRKVGQENFRPCGIKRRQSTNLSLEE